MPEAVRPRKRRGAQFARTVIIEAAAVVFAQKGYYGATMDDIATASDYSAAAIYKYFKNKEELFRHLWNHVAQWFAGIFDEAAALRMPFEYRLQWLMNAILKQLESNPDMVISFIAQRPYVAKGSQSALEAQACAHYRRHIEHLSTIMQLGIDEEALRPGSARSYALLFVALLYEFAYDWITAEGDTELVAQLDQFWELFYLGAGNKEQV